MSILVLMTDPAVAYDDKYGTYQHGHNLDIFLKANNGSESLGVVWPGSRFYNGPLSVADFAKRCYRIS